MESMTGTPASAPRSGPSAVVAESLLTTSLTSRAGEVNTGVGDLEVVLPDLESTVRWFQHGYPTPLARWHHHPEIEFHLIVASHGQMMAGDRTVDFAPGQVTLMGPDLPHNWLSDLGPGERLEERDVLCQVLPDRVARAVQILPELSDFAALVKRSRRGVILSGRSAARAGELLTAMGDQEGMERLATLLSLAGVFLKALDDEWCHIVSEGYVPSLDDVTARRVNEVLSYIEDSLDGEVSMEVAASRVAMSPSAFSRFFHATAGITFSALVRRRRIARACHLLRRTDLPVSHIADLSGYANLANFNRRFRDETGTTPSGYRKTLQEAPTGSVALQS